MIEYIKDLITTNQYVAPAMLAVFSGAISAAVLYLFRQLPMKIYSYFQMQFITTVRVATGSYDQDQVYWALLEELEQHRIIWLRRRWQIIGEWVGDSVRCSAVGGYGIDFYSYKGRYFKMVKTQPTEKEGGISGKIHEEVVLSWVGRSAHPVLEFIDGVKSQLQGKVTNMEVVTPVHLCAEDMPLIAETPRITLDDIAMEPEIRAALRDKIERFVTGAETKRRLGIANKLVILFHGEPGTGKTVLSRAIAGELKRSLYHFKDGCSLNKLSSLVHNKRLSNGVTLLDDIDTLGLADKRASSEPKSADKNNSPIESALGEVKDIMSTGHLGTFLDILDGSIPLNGNVIILTTNHLNKVDPAVYRDGRVTMLSHIGRLSASVVQEHFESLYGPLPELDGQWKPMLGASIYSIKDIALDCRERAIDELLKAFDKDGNVDSVSSLNKVA